MARAQVVFGERKKWKIWGLFRRRVAWTITGYMQGGKKKEESGKSPRFLAGATDWWSSSERLGIGGGAHLLCPGSSVVLSLFFIITLLRRRIRLDLHLIKGH